MIPRHILDHEALLYRDLVDRICAIINETMGARGMKIPNIAFTVISQLYALEHFYLLKTTGDFDLPARRRHLTKTIINVAAHFMKPHGIDYNDGEQRRAFYKDVGPEMFTYDLMIGWLQCDYADADYQNIPNTIAFWRRLRDDVFIRRSMLLYANDDDPWHDEHVEAGR